MNSLFNKYKWLKYVLGSFIIVIGLLIIILACLEPGSLDKVVNIVLAVGLILMGLFLLVSALLSETHMGFTPALITSAGLIAGGIILLVGKFALKVSLDQKLIVYIISLSTLVFGVVALIKSIFLIKYKENKGLVAIMIIVGIVSLVLGILGLCFADKLLTTSYIILGIGLVAIGIVFIVFCILADNKKERA